MATSRNFGALAIAFGAAAGAMAAPPAWAEGFDGPYVGIGGGLGILESKGSTLAGPFDRSEQDAVVTALAGYRSTIADTGLVLGGEGDVGINVDNGKLRYDLSGIGGMRIGGNSLVYGRVGYGWRDGLPGDAGKGLVLGGGFETKLAQSVNLRIDYRHHDLGGIHFPDNTVDYASHEVTGSVIYAF